MTFEEWWRGPREVPQTEAAAKEAWDYACRQVVYEKDIECSNARAHDCELIVMLREALEYFSPFDEMLEKAAIEALAATDKYMQK